MRGNSPNDTLECDLSSKEYHALKREYTKEARGRQMWQKFCRFRERLVKSGVSGRDAWLVTMQEYSIEFDLMSPLPPLVPIPNAPAGKPQFEKLPTGTRRKSEKKPPKSMTMEELSASVAEESEQARREQAGIFEDAGIGPLGRPPEETMADIRNRAAQKPNWDLEGVPDSGNAWDDMVWVYAHLHNKKMPDYRDYPPPSKGAVGLWMFAKEDIGKFYSEYYKAAAKNQEESDAVKSIEDDARSSAKEITRYLRDISEAASREAD